MGLFNKIAEKRKELAKTNKVLNTLMKAEKAVLAPAKAVYKTFTEPVVEAALTPVATLASEINRAVPGGKTGEEGIKLPIGGEVTPASEDKPMRAVGKTLEVATAIPGNVLKPVATAGASVAKKVAGSIAKSSGAKKIYKIVGETLVQAPEEDIYQALAPTTKAMKKTVAKITPEFLERGISGTRAGLKKQAEEGVKLAGEKFDELGKLTGTIKAERFLEPLKKLRESFVTKVGDNMILVGDDAKTRYKVVSRLIDDVVELGDDIPAEVARGLRKALDSTLQNFTPSSKDAAVQLANKTLANTIRSELAKDFPDFAKINKEYSFFKNLSDVLEATATRSVGQKNTVSRMFSSLFGGGLGSFFGPQGTAAGVVAGERLGKVFGSTVYKTTSAKVKKKIIDAFLDPAINPEKVANYIEGLTTASVKLDDFVQFLNEDARLKEEEAQALEQERLNRIEQVRREFFGDEEVAPERNEEEINAIFEEMRQKFSPQK